MKVVNTCLKKAFATAPVVWSEMKPKESETRVAEEKRAKRLVVQAQVAEREGNMALASQVYEQGTNLTARSRACSHSRATAQLIFDLETSLANLSWQ